MRKNLIKAKYVVLKYRRGELKRYKVMSVIVSKIPIIYIKGGKNDIQNSSCSAREV